MTDRYGIFGIPFLLIALILLIVSGIAIIYLPNFKILSYILFQIGVLGILTMFLIVSIDVYKDKDPDEIKKSEFMRNIFLMMLFLSLFLYAIISKKVYIPSRGHLIFLSKEINPITYYLGVIDLAYATIVFGTVLAIAFDKKINKKK